MGLLFDFNITFEEFEFHRWTELPLDVKKKILEYIPFSTLRNFMLLSKECFSLVTNMKYEVFHVYLCNLGPGPERTVENYVKLSLLCAHPGRNDPAKYSSSYNLHFVGDGKGGCYVERVTDRWKFPSPGLHYNGSPRSVALATLFHFSTYLNIQGLTVQLDALDPEAEQILATRPTTTFLARDNFHITTGAYTVVLSFLRFLQPGCSLTLFPLELFKDGEPNKELFLDTPVFDSPTVHSSQKIHIEATSGVKDHQIVKFQAYDITMRTPYVTAEAIRQIVLEWLERKREINFIHLKGLPNVTKGDILRGVECMPWEQFLNMIPNAWLWNGWSGSDVASLYNGVKFLVVLVTVDGIQLMDSMYSDE